MANMAERIQKKKGMRLRVCIALAIAATLLIIVPVIPLMFKASYGGSTSEGNNTSEGKNTSLVVKTQYGELRGVYEDGVRAFHGVPFAEPPVGALRWKPPQEPKPWSPNIYDASEIKPGCPQICSLLYFCPVNISEDCLYLEIYTPMLTSKSPRPVKVYIHGGSFDSVSAAARGYYPTQFVQRADIILVMVEYRLGSLGFLVTGEGENNATGNYGILDQAYALKWVRDNIVAFGGDPNKVTLAGQSAGAQSILQHLDSEETSQLFSFIIFESLPYTIQYKNLSQALVLGTRLASELNCLDTDHRINVSCLRNAEVQNILAAQDHVSGSLEKNIEKVETWAPVIDNSIVKKQSLQVLQDYGNQTSHRKPMIWGENTEEAWFFIFLLMTTSLPQAFYNLSISLIFPDIVNDVLMLYPSKSKDIREDISVLATDILFYCPLRRVLQEVLLAEPKPAMWSFMWARPIDAPLPENFAFCNGRACHSVEIPYVFQSFRAVNITPSAVDIYLSDSIIDYYSNFIFNGDPNNASRFQEDTENSTPNANQKTGNTSLPYWPQIGYNQTTIGRTNLIFTGEGQMLVQEDESENKHCDLWDTRGYHIDFRRR